VPRWAEWVVVIGALVYALLYALFEWGGPAAYVLGVLPAAVTFLVSRSPTGALVVFLIPMYFVIGQLTAHRPHYQPYTWLDAAMPLWPAWIFVYATLYVCAFLLPILLVRGRALIQQSLHAYRFVILFLRTDANR